MTSTPPTHSAPPLRGWLWLGAALLGGLLAFLPSLNNQFVSGDDDDFICNHHFVQNPSLDSAWRLFTYVDRDLYQPLAMLSLMLDTAVFGNDAFGHHVMNLVYHLLAIASVWLLARRLLPGEDLPGLTALLWGVHPLLSETVNIAVYRIPLLSALFTFLAVERFLKAVAEANPAGQDASRRWLPLVGINLLLILGQLCKATPLVAPAMLLLALATPLDPRPWRRRVRPALKLLLIPLVITVLFSVLTVYTTWRGNLISSYYNRSLLFNVALTLLALWQNLVGSFCPLWIAVWHPRPHELPVVPLISAGLGLAAFLGLAVWRGRQRPLVWAGLAWWLLLLAPTLPLLTTRFQLTADRYNYIALPGLIVAVLAAMALPLLTSAGQFPQPYLPTRKVTAGLILSAFVVGGLGLWISRISTAYYRDWTATTTRLFAVYTLEDPFIRLNHAQLLVEAGRLEEAEEEVQVLLAQIPDYAGVWRIKKNLAVRRGDLPAAREAAEQLIRNRPESSVGYQILGQVLRMQKLLPAAAAAYREALTRNQNDPKQYLELAELQEEMQDLPGALANYQLVTTRWPFHTRAWHLLGRLELQMDRSPEAVKALTRACQLAPQAGVIWGDLAAAYWGTGQLDLAREAACKALRLDPNLPGTRKLLEHLGP